MGAVDFKEMMRMKRIVFVIGFALLAVARPLFAQSGCVDSPEDPTLVLALVGGAGAMVAGIWRARRRPH